MQDVTPYHAILTATSAAPEVDWIIDRLIGVIGPNNLPCPLHRPVFSPSAQEYVQECMTSGWVATSGTFLNRFESLVAEFTGSPFVVATGTGTAALHASLLLAGVERDDEVLTPALTFVATANAVAYCGACPHFIDVDRTTMGVDSGQLEQYLKTVGHVINGEFRNVKTGRRIKALIGVHTFGHPFAVDAVLDSCQRRNIVLIEDAAQALGSWLGTRHAGTIGHLGVISFNGNKTATTAGGGVILVRDADLCERARHLTSTGKQPHPWSYFHDIVAYNYRLANLNAAVGCSQMEDLPRFLSAKRTLAQDYQAAFADSPVSFFREPDGCRSNYWLNALQLGETLAPFRDMLIQKMIDRHVQVRPVWTPLHRLPMYVDCPRMNLATTEYLERTLINVPSSPSLRMPGITPSGTPIV